MTKPLDRRCRHESRRDERQKQSPSARRQAAKSAHRISLLGPRSQPISDCRGHYGLFTGGHDSAAGVGGTNWFRATSDDGDKPFLRVIILEPGAG